MSVEVIYQQLFRSRLAASRWGHREVIKATRAGHTSQFSVHPAPGGRWLGCIKVIRPERSSR